MAGLYVVSYRLNGKAQKAHVAGITAWDAETYIKGKYPAATKVKIVRLDPLDATPAAQVQYRKFID